MSFNSTCWVGNRAYGNALAGTYSATIASVSNDFGVDNEIEHLSSLECEFVARIDGNDQSFPNIECANFTADECAFDISGPTPAPVETTPAPVAPNTEGPPTEGPPTEGTQPTAEGGAAEPATAPPTAAPTSSASVIRFVTGILAAAVALVAMAA